MRTIRFTKPGLRKNPGKVITVMWRRWIQFLAPFLVPVEASGFLFYIQGYTVPCPTVNARPYMTINQVTRFCNCSSVNNCNFYLLPDSYLDLGGAGVSSQFRDKHSSVGLPEHTPTEPKGSWYGNWQASKQGPKSRLICESLGPSAGCLAVTASSSLDQQENCTYLL